MQVCDDNVPQKCDAATAYIRVIREQFPPVFIDTPYNVDLSEFQQVKFTSKLADTWLTLRLLFIHEWLLDYSESYSHLLNFRLAARSTRCWQRMRIKSAISATAVRVSLLLPRTLVSTQQLVKSTSRSHCRPTEEHPTRSVFKKYLFQNF